ncbi:MAG: recombination protein RecR [Deltaproteobacteria bacterium]|nr:recombination protein RecR [Deltaproteobacteria bacterium]
MNSYPNALQGLVEHLMKLPGVGRKTAARLAFHMVRMPAEAAADLAAAIIEVKRRLSLCSFCQNLTEHDPCPICRDGARVSGQLCVVEYPADVASIENSGAFKGRYFVLHGLLAPMQGLGPDDLRLERLRQIVVEQNITEVVVATNPTVEGNATALFLSRFLRPLGVHLSRPACGLPVGADLEYMDPVTIRKSLDGRGPF